MKGSDARIFAVFLEKLPLTLDRHPSLSHQDHWTILSGMASALAYLKE